MNWVETSFWAGQGAAVPILSHAYASEVAAESYIQTAIGEVLPTTQRRYVGMLVICEYGHGDLSYSTWPDITNREMSARNFSRLMDGESRSLGVIRISDQLRVSRHLFVDSNHPAYLRAQAVFRNPWRHAALYGVMGGAVIGLFSSIVNHEKSIDTPIVSLISGALSGGVSAALFSVLNAMKGPKLAFGASFVASMLIEAGMNSGYRQLKFAVV